MVCIYPFPSSDRCESHSPSCSPPTIQSFLQHLHGWCSSVFRHILFCLLVSSLLACPSPIHFLVSFLPWVSFSIFRRWMFLQDLHPFLKHGGSWTLCPRSPGFFLAAFFFHALEGQGLSISGPVRSLRRHVMSLSGFSNQASFCQMGPKGTTF